MRRYLACRGVKCAFSTEAGVVRDGEEGNSTKARHGMLGAVSATIEYVEDLTFLNEDGKLAFYDIFSNFGF